MQELIPQPDPHAEAIAFRERQAEEARMARKERRAASYDAVHKEQLAAASSDWGKQVIKANVKSDQTAKDITVDGVPFEEFRKFQRLGSKEEAVRLAEILKKRGVAGFPDTSYPGSGKDQYDYHLKQLKMFDQENPEAFAPVAVVPEKDPELLDNAIPTGNATLDRPNLSRKAGDFAGVVGMGPQQLPTYAPDSPEGIMRQEAANGVDYRRGMGFSDRFKLATNISTPTVRAEVMEGILAQYAQGAEDLRVNENSGGIEYKRRVTEEDVANGLEEKGSVGKYRWTSLDSAGFKPADLAAALDPAEWGSMIGGVGASLTPWARGLTFFKTAEKIGKTGFIPGIGGVATETGGGLLGREVGNFIKLVVSVQQGYTPTQEEISDLFFSDVGKEIAAGFLGRTGNKIMEKVRMGMKQAEAGLDGKKIVEGSVDSVNERNALRTQAAEDTQALNAQLSAAGREEQLRPTGAEAETALTDNLAIKEGPTGQVRRLQEEADRRANAAMPSKLRDIRDSESQNLSALRSVAESFEQGSTRADPAMVNKAVADATNLRLSAVPGNPSRGRIHSTADAKYDPMGTNYGLEFQVQGNTMTVVGVKLPEDRQGFGLGSDLTRTFLNLAKAEGREARSSGSVSQMQNDVYLRMQEEGYPLERLSNDELNIVRDIDGNIEGYTPKDPSKNIWVMKAPADHLESLLASTSVVTRGADGKMTKGIGFDSFMKDASAEALTTVKREISSNTNKKADLFEEVYKHYQAAQKQALKGKDGYSARARFEWIADHQTTLEKIMTPDELLQLRQGSPDYFRKWVTDLADRRDTATTAIGSILKTSDPTKLMKSPGDLMRRLQTVPALERRRALAVVKSTSPETWKSIQDEMAAEVKDAAYKTVSGQGPARKAQQAFGEWLSERSIVIQEVMGKEYHDNLLAFNRATARYSVKQGVHGVRDVVNTPLIMAGRTLMGVMDTMQRRVTAARRIQLNQWYGRTMDIISDPDKLKQLISLTEVQARLPRGHSAVVGGAIRLGLVETQEEFEELMNASAEWIKWGDEKEETK